jgi:hypothetical protein
MSAMFPKACLFVDHYDWCRHHVGSARIIKIRQQFVIHRFTFGEDRVTTPSIDCVCAIALVQMGIDRSVSILDSGTRRLELLRRGDLIEVKGVCGFPEPREMDAGLIQVKAGRRGGREDGVLNSARAPYLTGAATSAWSEPVPTRMSATPEP